MITLLDPSQYRRLPWKNGGGVTTDIAERGEAWRFGRTPIVAAGPFSDYSGFDRVQVLVAGRGLVLQTPDGEIDLRTPFKPVRFAGETPITSRLEAGPVEVVNLIGKRSDVAIDLRVLVSGGSQSLGKATHFAYCPGDASIVEIDGKSHELPADHCLRIEAAQPTMLGCAVGRILAGSVTCVSR